MNSFKRAILHADYRLDKVRYWLVHPDRNFNLNDLQKFGNELPLHYAVRYRRLELTKLLLEYEADPNVPTEDGSLIFHSTFVLRNAELLDRFLDRGANIFAWDEHLRTMLHYAVTYSSLEIVEKLLMMKANVNAVDIFKNTPLHLLFDRKCVAEILPMMRLLVSYGTDINLVSMSCNSPLACAVRLGFMKAIEYLVSLGADLEGNKDFLLKHAVVHRQEEMVEFLLDKGADLYQRDRLNRNLLRLAYFHHVERRGGAPNFTNVVKMLIEKGLSVTREDDTSLELLKDMQHEVFTLKNTRIADDFNVTYYDLLTKRGNMLVKCLRNKTIRRVIESEGYKITFPHSSDRLRFNISCGLDRLEGVEQVFPVIYDVFSKVLPSEIILQIVENFTDELLYKIINKLSGDSEITEEVRYGRFKYDPINHC